MTTGLVILGFLAFFGWAGWHTRKRNRSADHSFRSQQPGDGGQYHDRDAGLG